jgi:hypothetical protein
MWYARAHNLMPGMSGMSGRNVNAKPYGLLWIVVEYTRAVRDMARYITMVDSERCAMESMAHRSRA